MANPLEDYKKLPTWGKVTVIGGGAVVVYYVYKNHQSSTAAASNSSAIDPVTGLPYSQDQQVDPITGMTYLAEAQAYGSVAAAESQYSYNTLGSTGTPVTGYTGSYTGSSGVLGTTAGYSSNAAWSQAAEQGLAAIGYDPTQVTDALGAYLNSQPLTPDQVTLVNDAIAEYGYPPSGGFSTPVSSIPNPPVSTGTATGTGTTSTGTGYTGSTSTGYTGSSGSTSAAQATISGGHVISVSNNTAVVGWTGHNATSYQTIIHGPGAINGHTGHVTIPQASYSGLNAGHDYVVTITPYNSAGQPGQSGNINLVTR